MKSKAPLRTELTKYTFLSTKPQLTTTVYTTIQRKFRIRDDRLERLNQVVEQLTHDNQCTFEELVKDFPSLDQLAEYGFGTIQNELPLIPRTP
ncbi:hypothetical protein BC833DRAFT_588682 [Globomyces pollinis-pini]|nr:hypothetical protein BC833DRAFT_588682 [Globomyces pollinis-pini]